MKLSDEEKLRRRAKRIENNLKKYGVEWPMQLKNVKEKRLQSMESTGYEKTKNTCIKKYGVDSHFKSKEIKDRIKSTNLQKFGVVNALSSKEVQDKVKQTNLKLYNSESYIETENFKEKRKKSCIDKFGVENISACQVVKDKKKETSLSRYNTECILNTAKVRDLKTQAIIKKYGVNHYLQSDKGKLQYKESCIDLYGVDNYLKSELVKKQKNKINENKRIAAYSNLNRFKNTRPLFTLEEFEGTGPKIYKWLKVDCNEEFYAAYWGYEPCGKFYHTSIESFLITYLDNNHIKYTTKDRSIISPLEIDFYLPDYNIAIETHGMYYHSTHKNQNNNYHFNKFKLCKDKGVRLIQIFEDEIINKPQTIINRLNYIFKLTKYKIYGRKCIIKEMAPAYKDKFLNKYHLQGTCQSKINLGAFYKNRLVSVMTFSQNRAAISQQINTWELTRFASLGKFSIIGIANKLFKHFIINYNQMKLKIITYSDLCWGEGNIYTVLGFKFIGYTRPGYFYSKNNYRFHRFNFRKSLLKTKLKLFDPQKSEAENMKNNNFLKIYNAGNAKYEIN